MTTLLKIIAGGKIGMRLASLRGITDKVRNIPDFDEVLACWNIRSSL